MTKKCKFEVDVAYNPDFFAEGEIKETIKKAIRDLNDAKESEFGKRVVCDPGKINSGAIASVTKITSDTPDVEDSCDIIETLVSLSGAMDGIDDVPQLTEPQLEELMGEVRTVFHK